MKTDLKPCPFCGEAMEHRKQYFSHPFNSDCILARQGYRNEQSEAWNTRTTQEASNAE